MNEFGAPAFSAPPHFLPVFDRARCTYCGRCAQRCPVGALAVEPALRRAWEIPGRCIGCGQCVLACEKQRAVSMRPVADYDEPPRSWLAYLRRAGPTAGRLVAGAWLRRSPIGRWL
jgi:NAD-dependent dihydropyrimidine dehydrogenase PreA subunit